MDGAGGTRQKKGVLFIGNGIFGKAASAGIAGEFGIIAEIFPVFEAVPAAAAGMAQPWDTDKVPGVEFCYPGADSRYGADNFVSENQGKLRIGEITVGNMQIGAADPTGMYLQKNLVRVGGGQGDLPKTQGHSRGI